MGLPPYGQAPAASCDGARARFCAWEETRQPSDAGHHQPRSHERAVFSVAPVKCYFTQHAVGCRRRCEHRVHNQRGWLPDVAGLSHTKTPYMKSAGLRVLMEFAVVADHELDKDGATRHETAKECKTEEALALTPYCQTPLRLPGRLTCRGEVPPFPEPTRNMHRTSKTMLSLELESSFSVGVGRWRPWLLTRAAVSRQTSFRIRE